MDEDENVSGGWVVDGVLLLLLAATAGWVVFGATMASAPFFGQQPDREDLLGSAGILFGGAVLVLGCCTGLAVARRPWWWGSVGVLCAALLAFAGEAYRQDALTTAGDGRGALAEGAREGVFQLPGLLLLAVALWAVVTGVRRRRARAARRP